jgi:protein-S-isoprenylcysteine O-methyltransferase Ste14
VWSIRTLGRFFRYEVVVQEGHRVVDTGPYRLVRHPSYTGSLLAFLGIGIALDNWLSVAAALGLPLLGFLRRIAVEEAALTSELGDAYRSYKERTRRLVPGIW